MKYAADLTPAESVQLDVLPCKIKLCLGLWLKLYPTSSSLKDALNSVEELDKILKKLSYE